MKGINNINTQKRFLILMLCMSLLAVSCARNSGNKNVDDIIKECILPEEQKNSLQGKWSSTPIKISFRAGQWNSGEVNAIQTGANTWNTFFSASKGIAVFDFGPFGSGYVSTQNQTAPACGSPTLSDGTVLYKRASNWTKSANAVALTTICSQSNGSELPQIFNAIIEFNYVHFFTSQSGRYPDLESIALHELGHLLGLDHACGPTKNGLPNAGCPDHTLEPNNPLVEAVMNPDVFFNGGVGEVKRALKANDQGRANCIYESNN